MGEDSADPQWYAVRCLFQLPADDGFAYEERITLWRATSAEDAVEQAEIEAFTYMDGMDFKYVKLAQSFHLFDPPDHGKEVFSSIRESELHQITTSALSSTRDMSFKATSSRTISGGAVPANRGPTQKSSVGPPPLGRQMSKLRDALRKLGLVLEGDSMGRCRYLSKREPTGQEGHRDRFRAPVER